MDQDTQMLFETTNEMIYRQVSSRKQPRWMIHASLIRTGHPHIGLKGRERVGSVQRIETRLESGNLCREEGSRTSGFWC